MDDQDDREYSRAPELEDLLSLCKALNAEGGRYEPSDTVIRDEACEMAERVTAAAAERWRIITLVCLCAAAFLVVTCQQRETPLWPPNGERADITPSEWMVGCFAIDPMTDRLRAAGAREAIELTARRVDVVDGRQRYRGEMKGSHLKYGVWTPLNPKTVRVEVGSNGFDNLTYTLSRSNDRLVGTYREIGHVSPGASPEVPVSFRESPAYQHPRSRRAGARTTPKWHATSSLTCGLSPRRRLASWRYLRLISAVRKVFTGE